MRSDRTSLRSPSAGDVGVISNDRSKSFNTGLSAAYGAAHKMSKALSFSTTSTTSSHISPSTTLELSHPFHLLHNPVNVLVFQHDQAHSFVEGRIISVNFEEKKMNVRSFISNTIMENVRFEDIVELGRVGRGINWEKPSIDDKDKYVAVFWPDDGRWYAAIVDQANDGSARLSKTLTEENGLSTHHLKYLDGTEGQWLHLGHERYTNVPPHVISAKTPPEGMYGSISEMSQRTMSAKSNAHKVCGPPKVALFRALTSTPNALPERGEFIEGRVLASEQLSLLIDIGDGIKRRVSRTISVVLSDFNSTAASSTKWNDVGRRMAIRSRPSMTREGDSTSGSSSNNNSGNIPNKNKRMVNKDQKLVKWEEAVVISYRSRMIASSSSFSMAPDAALQGEHQVQYVRSGVTEYINLEDRRFVWIDGVAASPLDNSDMPVILRVGDRCKARWQGGSHQNPEHYIAIITKMSKTGASLKFARKALGEAENVAWNDIEQCRATMTTEAATKLQLGDMVSARWRHGTHWSGWYVACVAGVFLNRTTNQIVVRVSYDHDHEDIGNDDEAKQLEDLFLHDLQCPVLFPL